MSASEMTTVLRVGNGPMRMETLFSAVGPYVLLTLPGGQVSLLVTDQGALFQLGSTCLRAAQQLRSATLRHEAQGVA